MALISLSFRRIVLLGIGFQVLYFSSWNVFHFLLALWFLMEKNFTAVHTSFPLQVRCYFSSAAFKVVLVFGAQEADPTSSWDGFLWLYVFWGLCWLFSELVNLGLFFKLENFLVFPLFEYSLAPPSYPSWNSEDTNTRSGLPGPQAPGLTPSFPSLPPSPGVSHAVPLASSPLAFPPVPSILLLGPSTGSFPLLL